ncbi:aromatic-ring-hydroxylating dioxygenase subunit beta [soil metagenome]
MNDMTRQHAVVDLYSRYAESICDGHIDQWPEFFTEKCLYRLVPRTNHDRGLRIDPMFAESKGALKDRVTAISETLVYAARSLTHTVSGARIVEVDGDIVRARSMLSVYQTLVDGNTRLQLVGRTFDTIDTSGPAYLFSERLVVFDTELLAGALVFPV